MLKRCKVGGFPADAFDYVKENGGIESEEDNPYKEADTNDDDSDATCVEDGNYVATVSGFEEVDEADEDALKEAVARQVGVDMFIIKYCKMQWKYMLIIIIKSLYSPLLCPSTRIVTASDSTPAVSISVSSIVSISRVVQVSTLQKTAAMARMTWTMLCWSWGQ